MLSSCRPRPALRPRSPRRARATRPTSAGTGASCVIPAAAISSMVARPPCPATSRAKRRSVSCCAAWRWRTGTCSRWPAAWKAYWLIVVDARIARRHFERAAKSYAGASRIESEIGARMLERLDYVKLAPKRVLDAVSGPPQRLLSKRYRDAEVIAFDTALVNLHLSKVML